jgi:hypothetical protein
VCIKSWFCFIPFLSFQILASSDLPLKYEESLYQKDGTEPVEDFIQGTGFSSAIASIRILKKIRSDVPLTKAFKQKKPMDLATTKRFLNVLSDLFSRSYRLFIPGLSASSRFVSIQLNEEKVLPNTKPILDFFYSEEDGLASMEQIESRPLLSVEEIDSFIKGKFDLPQGLSLGDLVQDSYLSLVLGYFSPHQRLLIRGKIHFERAHGVFESKDTEQSLLYQYAQDLRDALRAFPPEGKNKNDLNTYLVKSLVRQGALSIDRHEKRDHFQGAYNVYLNEIKDSKFSQTATVDLARMILNHGFVPDCLSKDGAETMALGWLETQKWRLNKTNLGKAQSREREFYDPKTLNHRGPEKSELLSRKRKRNEQEESKRAREQKQTEQEFPLEPSLTYKELLDLACQAFREENQTKNLEYLKQAIGKLAPLAQGPDQFLARKNGLDTFYKILICLKCILKKGSLNSGELLEAGQTVIALLETFPFDKRDPAYRKLSSHIYYMVGRCAFDFETRQGYDEEAQGLLRKSLSFSIKIGSEESQDIRDREHSCLVTYLTAKIGLYRLYEGTGEGVVIWNQLIANLRDLTPSEGNIVQEKLPKKFKEFYKSILSQ